MRHRRLSEGELEVARELKARNLQTSREMPAEDPKIHQAKMEEVVEVGKAVRKSFRALVFRAQDEAWEACRMRGLWELGWGAIMALLRQLGYYVKRDNNVQKKTNVFRHPSRRRLRHNFMVVRYTSLCERGVEIRLFDFLQTRREQLPPCDDYY